jgi:hypothetical protein
MIRSEYKLHPITAAAWEGRGIGRHTPVGSSSPAKRPSLDEGCHQALEQPCSPLFYLHSPPTPRSSLLHHPQPHVLLRPQRRAPGTTAAALSTGTERGRKGRLRERDERKQATEVGAAGRREARRVREMGATDASC